MPCHSDPCKNAVKVALSLTAKNAVRMALADRVKMRAFCVFEFFACKNAAENGTLVSPVKMRSRWLDACPKGVWAVSYTHLTLPTTLVV